MKLCSIYSILFAWWFVTPYVEDSVSRYQPVWQLHSALQCLLVAACSDASSVATATGNQKISCHSGGFVKQNFLEQLFVPQDNFVDVLKTRHLF